jgi:hypothetical protein
VNVAIRIVVLLIALLGCAEMRTGKGKDQPTTSEAHYVTLGSHVLCLSSDSRCLRAGFDSCLGESRKKHLFENGPPDQMSVSQTEGTDSEWRLRGSEDRITITYDQDGIARKWRYMAAWGTLKSRDVKAALRSGEPFLKP